MVVVVVSSVTAGGGVVVVSGATIGSVVVSGVVLWVVVVSVESLQAATPKSAKAETEAKISFFIIVSF